VGNFYELSLHLPGEKEEIKASSENSRPLWEELSPGSLNYFVKEQGDKTKGIEENVHAVFEQQEPLTHEVGATALWYSH
jgi:hypothetical protein